jgi:PPOX class probable F420-dependent enzyme
MPFTIDTSTPFGERAERRLRDDRLAWLTTTSADGTPQPVPVWFLWDGGSSFLIYSKPGTAKLRNIAERSRVALHLDGDGQGGDIVVLSGTASIERDGAPAHAVPAYCAKYAWGFERLRKSAEEFSAAYPVPVRIELTRLRGH